MTNQIDNMNAFVEHMKGRGWIAGNHQFQLRKGDWIIVLDTSSWIEVGTIDTPRIFDVPIPDPRLMQWTENLISHLCETSDALNKVEPAK